MKAITALFLLCCINYVYSQDTVKVMHYNLLYYGETTNYCDNTNNNVDNKDTYISKIINHTKPDIFTVNEMGASPQNADRLLNNTLNISGLTRYSKAGFTNNANSNIVNMLFYNSTKFVLHGQTVIVNSLRDINVYKLYYKSPDISTQNDTAFLTCIVAHLKAGSSSSDEDQRAYMTQQIMNYMSNNNITGNVLMMGDLNTYSSSEQCFQKLVNYSESQYNFYDPVDKMGAWNNNSYYAEYHTQSTHSYSDCFAGGGLDDRFDFILISNSIENKTDKIEYVPSSYHALGQDGNRFNSTIKDPSNSSVPSDIADALYGNSDHLPVILDLKINQTPATISNPENNDFNIVFENPVKDFLNIKVNSKQNTGRKYNIKMYNIVGELLWSKTIKENPTKIDVGNFSKGLYILKISDSEHKLTQKVIIK